MTSKYIPFFLLLKNNLKTQSLIINPKKIILESIFTILFDNIDFIKSYYTNK